MPNYSQDFNNDFNNDFAVGVTPPPPVFIVPTICFAITRTFTVTSTKGFPPPVVTPVTPVTGQPFSLMLAAPNTSFIAPISLVFQRPDDSFYYVSPKAYLYSAKINFTPYVVYNVQLDELEQPGWWLVYFQTGVWASQQYQFYVGRSP